MLLCSALVLPTKIFRPCSFVKLSPKIKGSKLFCLEIGRPFDLSELVLLRNTLKIFTDLISPRKLFNFVRFSSFHSPSYFSNIQAIVRAQNDQEPSIKNCNAQLFTSLPHVQKKKDVASYIINND